ncbi:hypothetical protein RB195_014299 [Necator americanus]|uniref:Uncharacterized protein n=1 Tax=Necator americanus TaxID=51031 RepID=A0ABR1DZK2_NECAM
MTENYLDRPIQTHDTYKVCSHGPVEIYYIPNKEAHPENKFAFQHASSRNFYTAEISVILLNCLDQSVQSCWEPLMCSTATCYTRVICQSDVPVFIPTTANVWVEGKNVNLYIPLSSRVILEQDENESKVRTKPRSPDIPEEGIVVIYAADMRKFNEWVQVVVTDNMTVYCQGGNSVYFSKTSSATVFQVLKNVV